MPKILPTDAFAIKTIGLDAWRRDFYWPVSDAAYSEMADTVLDRLDQLLLELPPEMADLVLCDVGFFGFLIQHFHALAVKAACRRLGYELLVDKAKEFYEPKWDDLECPVSITPSNREKLYLKMRQALKGLVFSKGGRCAARLEATLGKADLWCVGSHARLLEDYLRENDNGACSYFYAQALIDAPESKGPAPLSPSLTEGLSNMFEWLRSHFADRFELDFDSGGAFQTCLGRLGFLEGLSASLRRLRFRPSRLLCTQPSDLLCRLVSRVFMESDVRVTAFAHGNAIGLLLNRMTAYSQASMCHQFICPSRAATDLYCDIQSMTSLDRLRRVEFLSCSHNQLEEWHKEFAGEKKDSPIRVVMLIGHPMNHYRYALSQGDFFLFQAELELQILRRLREMGLITVYKVHPERIREATGLFEAECDKILTEPFEEVWAEADAFVFSSNASTTFGFALCTPRRVVVVELEGMRWNPSAYASLSHRCNMVPATYGPGNRPELDNEAFSRAFSPEAGGFDAGFVREFMYP